MTRKLSLWPLTMEEALWALTRTAPPSEPQKPLSTTEKLKASLIGLRVDAYKEGFEDAKKEGT